MLDFFKDAEETAETSFTNKLTHFVGHYGHIIGECTYLFFTYLEGHGGHAIAAAVFLGITLYNAWNGDLA